MNAALVKLDVAAAALGWSAVKLLSLADEGTLLEPGFTWVWNLANNLDGERRDLRWWVPEVEARAGNHRGTEAQRNADTLSKVVDLILPPARMNFHAGEVDQLFQIRHRTRLDYGLELNGGIVSGRTLYPRATLVEFLRRRWLGAGQSSSRPIHTAARAGTLHAEAAVSTIPRRGRAAAPGTLQPV